MSSMVSKLRSHPKAMAAIVAAGAAIFAAPCTAQLVSQGSGNELVAKQPGEIAAALSRWEALHSKQTFGFSDYANFALEFPSFPRTPVLRRKAEAALDEQAPSALELIRFFDANPPLTNPARARYALALAGVGRPEAFEVARAAWRGGTMSGPGEAYLETLYGTQFTAEDHAARIDALLWQGDSEAATRQLTKLAPADRPLALARLALIGRSNPQSAGSSIPSDAMGDPGYVFNRVRYLRATNQTAQAIRVLSTRGAFERPAYDPERMLGDMLALAKAASAADTVQIARRVDDLFEPGTDVSAGSFVLRDRYTDLMWKGGTNALWRLRDGATAAPLFERYGKGARTPLTRSKGFYWAGRAAREAGRSEDASRYFEMAAQFPHYYYGQLALAALGRSMPDFAPLPELQVDQSVKAQFDAQPLTQAIRALAANRRDWRTERRFFQAIGESAKTPEELLLVNELARETGLEEMAVVVGMKADEESFAGFERVGFPVLEVPRVNDWTMVHAISRQESEFDQFRISHAGARGVMQLMPGTAREQAGKLGVRYMSASLIDSPSYNIQLGDAYFARMMNYYGGAYPLAIGAYNAGPGRVNQWLRLNGDPRKGEIDWVTWVEKIPANFETRYYIMRVIGNAVSYSHMYPEQAGLPRPVNTFLP